MIDNFKAIREQLQFDNVEMKHNALTILYYHG